VSHELNFNLLWKLSWGEGRQFHPLPLLRRTLSSSLPNHVYCALERMKINYQHNFLIFMATQTSKHTLETSVNCFNLRVHFCRRNNLPFSFVSEFSFNFIQNLQLNGRIEAWSFMLRLVVKREIFVCCLKNL
jgi:hypothetical protein